MLIRWVFLLRIELLIRWLVPMLLVGAAMPASAAGSPGNRPAQVASINLCADQLLLLLADPSQIVSLSNLSVDKSGSYYHREAARYPLNRGIAEQLMPLEPDLIIAGQYSSSHTVALLKELGLRVETLAIADSMQALMHNVLQVAGWLGQRERGDAIVQDLKARLHALPAPAQQRPKAAVYDPNGYTVGEQTMRGQILSLAGWHNVAIDAGIEHYGHLSIEQLIKLAPDALLESPYSAGTYSRGQALGQHPALRKAGIDPLIIEVPSRMTICAGPWTLDVVEELLQQRLKFGQAAP